MSDMNRGMNIGESKIELESNKAAINMDDERASKTVDIIMENSNMETKLVERDKTHETNFQEMEEKN